MVLETPQDNLSRLMHRLQTAYTVYFNRKHRRNGHLLQGRFGSTLVDEDEYILKLSRYVRAPVVAYALCQYAGCTQRAAAQVMGLQSGVAVSLQIKRLNEQRKSDRKLEDLLMKLKQRLIVKDS